MIPGGWRNWLARLTYIQEVYRFKSCTAHVLLELKRKVLMKRILLIIAVLLFCAPSYALEIAVGPTYQDLDLSGTVKADGGTEIDVENDLGLDNDKPVGVNLHLGMGKHNFDFNLAQLEFSGTKTLARTVTFDNQTFNVNTSVESTVEYDLYEAQYSYKLLEIGKEDMLKVSLSPLFKVSIYDASVELKSTGVNASYSKTLPIPTLGALGEIDFTRYLSLLGQVSAIGYSGDSYLEYKTVLRLKPVKYLNFDVGYKGTSIKFSESNNLIDIDAKGLYLEGAFVYKF